MRKEELHAKLVDLPELAVIGKQGLCTPESNQANALWACATAHFDEIAALGMRERDGAYTGYWGAMSDEGLSFLPWTQGYRRGLYLAGLEVDRQATPPDGWTKWVMPARRYLSVDVQPERYDETFSYVLGHLLPEMGLRLCGAACDYIKPSTGARQLFFPVE